MPPTDRRALDGLSQDIGALKEGIKNLKATVDEERLDAKMHRQSLREVIASLTESIRLLTSQIAEIKPVVETVRSVPEVIAEIRPVVEQYRTSRNEAQGRHKLGKLLWGFVVVFAGLVGSAIGAVVASILGRSGH
jgi:chromosome segregation ATPase